MKSVKLLILIGAIWWGYRMVTKGYTTALKQPEEVDLLARTAWGEARGEGATGMEMIMHVVMNRVKRGGWWGATVSDVVKKPYQFSTWNKNDPNYQKMLSVDLNDTQFKTAVQLAQSVYSGELTDKTGGATHYHSNAVNPSWADSSKITAVYGNHIFYKGIA